MKIMCLNGWGGTLHDKLVAYLTVEQPDILCLQEVVHSPESLKEWLTYRDGDHILPQRANFFSDIVRCLPDHVAIFCPAAQGVLWDEQVSVRSQWGLATFVHKSLPIIGQTQDFVHKHYSHDGFGEHPRSRSAHAVRVFDASRNQAVCVAHMHGLRDLRGKMDSPERAEQARKFLSILRQTAKPSDLEIMCGDFNVEPESETLELFANAGFTELVTRKGFAGTRSSHYKKPMRFADYMLVSDVNAVTSFDAIYEPEVSDHCPLLLCI